MSDSDCKDSPKKKKHIRDPPTSVIIDSSSPYYLHPSDNPGQLLISERFAVGGSFETWKRSMTIALSEKNKLVFVDGELPKPSIGDPLMSFWIRCNNMVQGWLNTSLHPQIAKSVLYGKSASSVWKELIARYGQTSKVKVFQVQQDMYSISQNNEDVSTYFSKAKEVWDEYSSIREMPRCSCGCTCDKDINLKIEEYEEETKILHFLRGLDHSYIGARGHILMIKPFPDLSQVYSMLIQEEEQRELRSLSSSSHPTIAATSSLVGSTEGPKFMNPSRPNIANKGRDGKRNTFVCSHCKRNGHTVDRCFYLYGFPKNWTPRALHQQAGSARNAAVVHSSGTSKNQEVNEGVLPGFNHEESQRILQLMSEFHNKDLNVAHMAGPFTEEASGAW